MKKLKHLLLALFLSVSLVLGGCATFVVTNQPGQEDKLSDILDKEDLENVVENADENDSENQSGDIGVNDSQGQDDDSQSQSNQQENSVEYGESYTSKEEVALYLHLYEELPPNFITKKEAKKLGWDNQEGNLSEVAPGMSIGGDYFGNYEGILPEEKEYHECDIDSDGGYRNAKRIVYSEDGCIYYTEDHYESFELLYGEE